MARLDGHLLLRRRLAEVAENVASHRIHVLAALGRVDTVDETHRTSAVVGTRALVRIEVARENRCHLPPGSALLVGEGGGALTQEELYELLESIGGHGGAVPAHLDVLAAEGREFIRACL